MQDRLQRGEGSISRSGKKHKALARIGGRNRYVGVFDTYEQALEAIRIRRTNGSARAAPTGPREYEPDTPSTQTEEPARGNPGDTEGPTLRSWHKAFLKKRQEEGRRNFPEERLLWKTRVSKAHFYDWPLTAIGTKDVRSWIREVARTPTKRTKKPPKRQTVLNVLNALRIGLSYAVEDDLIAVNPAKGIKVARTDETEEPWTWLTLAEIEAIKRCDDIPPIDKSAMLFAIYSGLRQGEVFGLRWSDIDMTTNTITVCRSWTTATKSKKVRRIPLFAPARDIILEHKRSTKGTFYVFPGRGGRVHKKGYSANWRKNRLLAGIKRRVRFHDARHTFATHLVSGSWGRSWRLEEIQILLGHSTIHMVQRYAHMIGGGVFRAAEETFVIDQPDAAE
jgi:integrase